jgi:hypothetical protein
MVTTAARTHHVTVHVSTRPIVEVCCSCDWRAYPAKDAALLIAAAHLREVADRRP